MDLSALLAPIRLDEAPAPPPAETAAFHAWLRANASQELADWNDALTRIAVEGGYRNALFAAHVSTLAEVLAIEHDAARAGRIRSVFCGTSPILEDREDLWFATWGATDAGTSVVFRAHQDERAIWPVAPSLADFILQQYRDDHEFVRSLPVPEAIAALPVRDGGAPLHPAFDPEKLTERVHWIVALLFPEGDWYGLGNGLVAAPAFARFAEEEALLPRAPHLIAYWLLHHLVFGNRESYARLAALGRESAYPTARELAGFGDGARPAWWDADAVARLNAEALRDHVDVFEPAALAAMGETQGRRAALRQAIRAKIAALPRSAAGQVTLAVLEGEKLEAIDGDIIRALRPDPPEPDSADRELEALLLAKRGDAPGLGVLFRQIPQERSDVLAAIGDDVAALCETGEANPDLTAIAVLLGRARSGAGSDRFGRLARVAIALTMPDEASLAFVRGEAARFFATLHERVTDTAALAAVALLERRDPVAIAALVEAVEARAPHGGSGRMLLDKLGEDPVVAAALEAFVRRGFGRPLEGEPVRYAVALARSDASRARALLEPRLADPAEPPEQRAVTLAGLLVACAGDASVRDGAVALLAQLDPAKERQAAAGIALLRVVHEAGIEGFAAEATRWNNAKRSKHVGNALKRWFEATASEIR